MIVAMAGLPGTGKSTLAYEIAEKLPALVLNKDSLRAAIFSSGEIEYSTFQDDFVFGIMLQIANYYIQKEVSRNIILDGRPLWKKSQVDNLINFSQENKWDLRIIYCKCSNKVAKARIERDATNKEHFAANRNYGLYRRLQAESDPLQVPHLSVDTGESVEICTLSCLNYLNNHPKKLQG